MPLTEVVTGLVPDQIQMVLNEAHVSAQVFVLVFVIAFNWSLMKILLSLFNRSKIETNLRNICCKAQRQIYYFEAEKDKLKAEIDAQRQRAESAEEIVRLAEERIIPLDKSVAKLKAERNQLHQRVQSLESELEAATEAGFEANRLLNDFLTSQKENIDLCSSVDSLQQQINKQTEVVTKYEAMAKQKERENRDLIEKFDKVSTESDRLKILLKECEHNLEIFRSNNEELKASKNELVWNLNNLNEEYSCLKSKNDECIETNERLLSDIQSLSSEINTLKEYNKNKDLENETFKRILEEMRQIQKNSEIDSEDEGNDCIDSKDRTLSDVLDIVKMEILVKNLTKEKNELISKFEAISEQCEKLNHRLVICEENNSTLSSEKESAIQNKLKLEVELEVMTKYYKAKELEYNKEIGAEHIQRQLKEEDNYSITDRLSAVEEENTSLRDQLKVLSKENAEKERQYKSQINQLEKQVHENWILARDAERKLDEAKTEASVLRQTLTMSVKSPIDGFGADSFIDDSSSSISDHLSGFAPPPPPPPPPPIFNGMMPPMPMPFNESMHSSGLWNTSEHPIVSQQSEQTIAWHPNQTDMNSTYGSYSYPQQTSQWDASMNAKTESAVPQYNSLDTQNNNFYMNPISAMATTSLNSYHNSIPPMTTSVGLSYSMQQNTNFNYFNGNNNESNGSRPQSRSQLSNDISFQTSII